MDNTQSIDTLLKIAGWANFGKDTKFAIRAAKAFRAARAAGARTPSPRGTIVKGVLKDTVKAPFRAIGEVEKYGWSKNKPLTIGANAAVGAGGINMVVPFAGGDSAGERFIAPTKETAKAIIRGGKNIAVEGVSDAVDSLNQAPQETYTTTKATTGSIGNLLNPFSSITGGKEWVPEKVLNMFGTDPEKQRLAAAAWKTGAIGLLAAAGIGGYRALRHINEMRDLSSADRPGKGLSSQVSTTFAGKLSGNQKKRKKKKDDEEEQNKAASLTKVADQGAMPDNNFTPTTFFRAAVPTGALLLAGALAYKGIDEAFDSRRNKQLDKAIAAKENAIKNLITTRARIAKGNVDDNELKSALRPISGDDIYVKEAAGNPVGSAVSTAGVMASAIVLASAIGSYAYFSAGDENNIKYKAYKKALKEYAKNKSGITPVSVMPTDAKKYFSNIDEKPENAAPVSPRNQPYLDTDSLNKPISISF